MKKPFQILFAIMLLAFALLVLIRPGSEKNASRNTNEILRDLVRSHPVGLEEDALLKELRQTDEAAAEQWQRILSCWDASGNDMMLNQNVLPDGLVDSNQLCLIVLGYQLKPDGSMEAELIGRLETALNCAEKYPDCWILCTGGGTASQNPDVTEADAMAGWLTEHGIAPERMIVENQSLTTTQNAIFSHRILTEKYPEITKIALVSSDYHIPWASILFDTQFILGGDGLELISNAVYPTNQKINSASLVRYQMNGILEIAGLD